MSLNLLSYTAANHLEWERYADIVNQWANGHGLYPGTPPAGYQECFKIKQKYTPVPKDYPDLLHASSRVKDVPSTASAKVSMSATAFGTILQSQQVFMENVMDNNRRNNDAEDTADSEGEVDSVAILSMAMDSYWIDLEVERATDGLVAHVLIIKTDGGVNTAADDGVDEPDTAADVDEPFGPDDIPEEGELDDVEDTGMDMAGIQT
ncbi:hypothetical protein GGX14DRAFT_700927 [Mycena pura]|uniref:Uncharacterized protein n=1 Tax=Mycena pura TaxID=153505 RepID=A0AAD6UTN6_9AGAR|nr:hypothetical protein GGX14DRAFT_700927 [Mycena pura]